MRTLLLLFPMLPACVGVVFGDGDTISVAREAASFQDLQSDGMVDVEVTAGDTASLSVVCDANLVDHIETRVEAGRLIVDVAPNLVIQPRGACRVEAVTPTLDSLRVSGSARVAARGFTSVRRVEVDGSGGAEVDGTQAVADLTVDVSGSGNVWIEGVATGDATVDIAGSGAVELAGAADHATVDISGSGEARAEDLRTRSAEIDLSGSGGASILTLEAIHARISGSGQLDVWGDPEVRDVRVDGSGGVRWR